MPASRQNALPVRVPGETYTQLKELAARAARDGWRSLGVDRDDPPTLAAVISEAVAWLATRSGESGVRSRQRPRRAVSTG